MMLEQSWHPTISIPHLKARADILKIIREFFAVRGVIEVETPILSQYTVTDPYLSSLSVDYQAFPDQAPKKFYLQTSPEYAMKRLLAAGSGPIYQIAKAFRVDVAGKYHNPEFTLLEWYRPGFTHRDLMLEVDAFLRRILHCEIAQCFTYQALFLEYCKIDPHNTCVAELYDCAQKNGLSIHQAENIKDITTWLQLLMMHLIEPHLGQHNRPSFVTDFPIEQAMLAKINYSSAPPVAERFEVYWKGMELANGFHELNDAGEQRKRFIKNNETRLILGLPELELDENFLAALEHGLPDCSGIALGIDRLMMAALGEEKLKNVLSFSIERA